MSLRVLNMLRAVAPDGLSMTHLRNALAEHDCHGNVIRRETWHTMRDALRVLEARDKVRRCYVGNLVVWHAK